MCVCATVFMCLRATVHMCLRVPVHVCLHVCGCVCAVGEGPIKKLPEERAFSGGSVGGRGGWQSHCVSEFHPESLN